MLMGTAWAPVGRELGEDPILQLTDGLAADPVLDAVAELVFLLGEHSECPVDRAGHQRVALTLREQDLLRRPRPGHPHRPESP